MSRLAHAFSISRFACKYLFSLFITASASAQLPSQESASNAPTGDSKDSAAVDTAASIITLEEIVVTAQRPIGSLRLELETLQTSFFADYNDLNPNDEFDVTCRKSDFTHTRIQQTLCLPQFFYDAMAEQTREGFIYQNFSTNLNMAQLARALGKEFEELSANILAVANANPELAASLLQVGKVEAAIRRKQEECTEGPGFLFFKLCK